MSFFCMVIDCLSFVGIWFQSSIALLACLPFLLCVFLLSGFGSSCSIVLLACLPFFLCVFLSFFFMHFIAPFLRETCSVVSVAVNAVDLDRDFTLSVRWCRAPVAGDDGGYCCLKGVSRMAIYHYQRGTGLDETTPCTCSCAHCLADLLVSWCRG